MNKGIVTKVIATVAVAAVIGGGALVWHGVAQAREDAHVAQIEHAQVVAAEHQHELEQVVAAGEFTQTVTQDITTQQQIAAQQAAEAAAAAKVAADAVAAQAAAQQAAQKAAQQAAAKKTTTTVKTRTATTNTTTTDPQSPAPVRCPAGSQAVSGNAGNDTSCLPSVCFTIVLPDATHPECNTPFKP